MSNPVPPPRPKPPPLPKPASSFIKELGELPIKTLLALLIPTLMFGGCCFTLAVGMVASQFDNGVAKQSFPNGQGTAMSSPEMVAEPAKAVESTASKVERALSFVDVPEDEEFPTPES